MVDNKTPEQTNVPTTLGTEYTTLHSVGSSNSHAAATPTTPTTAGAARPAPAPVPYRMRSEDLHAEVRETRWRRGSYPDIADSSSIPQPEPSPSNSPPVSPGGDKPVPAALPDEDEGDGHGYFRGHGDGDVPGTSYDTPEWRAFLAETAQFRADDAAGDEPPPDPVLPFTHPDDSTAASSTPERSAWSSAADLLPSSVRSAVESKGSESAALYTYDDYVRDFRSPTGPDHSASRGTSTVTERSSRPPESLTGEAGDAIGEAEGDPTVTTTHPAIGGNNHETWRACTNSGVILGSSDFCEDMNQPAEEEAHEGPAEEEAREGDSCEATAGDSAPHSPVSPHSSVDHEAEEAILRVKMLQTLVSHKQERIRELEQQRNALMVQQQELQRQLSTRGTQWRNIALMLLFAGAMKMAWIQLWRDG